MAIVFFVLMTLALQTKSIENWPVISTENDLQITLLKTIETYPDDTVDGLLASITAVDFEDNLVAINYYDAIANPRVQEISYVWNMETNELLYTVESLKIVGMSQGGNYFIAENFQDNIVALLDKVTGEIVFQATARSIWTSPNDLYVATLDAENFEVSSVVDEKVIVSIPNNSENALGFCPDSRCLALLNSVEGSVAVWDEETNFTSKREILYRSSGLDFTFSRVLPFSADGRSLIIIESLESFVVPLNGDPSQQIVFPSSSRSLQLELPAELPIITYVSLDGSVNIYSLATDEILGQLEGEIVAFNDDQTMMITQYQVGNVLNYSLVAIEQGLPSHVFYTAPINSYSALQNLSFGSNLIVAKTNGDAQVVLFGIP